MGFLWQRYGRWGWLLLLLVLADLALLLVSQTQQAETGFGLLAYLLFDLMLVLPLWLLLGQLERSKQQLQEMATLTTQLDALMQQAHLPLSQSDSLSAKLTLLQQNQQAQVRREQEIRHLVRVQGLIDHDLAIGNRIYFESKLQHYLNDPQEPASGALFLIQVSHPEMYLEVPLQVQRLAGCAELLTQLSAHMPQTVLARIADNDLAVLLPGLAQKDAEIMGDRMASILSRSSYFADYLDFDVLHIGYVIYQQGQGSYQLMAEADMALKTAQLQGPNAAYGFYPSHKPKIKGSVWWRTELTNALKEQRLILTFQPVFSWEQHDVIQHEVLVRLQSSEGDKLNAAVFLPMAANCGLTQAIDQYVLLKAAKLCQLENFGANRCSVNLAVETLLSNEWRLWLSEMLAQGQVNARQFAFEVDEYHLQKNYRKLKPVLSQLQQQGFALIIDHVGLSIDPCPYLDDLQVEAIKLHPSVVRHLDQQLEQQLFVRGLISCHTNKGVRVIATGVETLKEWQVLQKLGVSGAQGYYFSQPLARIIPQDQPH
ncbi:EAL domain-containing protein [Rheinheimera sp.]|uniref:EAL domain-containing protein n=1 Tax=Rheinheimera sp. TaxID=1869214 RepID=UPI0027B8B7F1|nr:EAL domain-containing protein [Rheinheimera sp.]